MNFFSGIKCSLVSLLSVFNGSFRILGNPKRCSMSGRVRFDSVLKVLRSVARTAKSTRTNFAKIIPITQRDPLTRPILVTFCLRNIDIHLIVLGGNLFVGLLDKVKRIS